MVLVKFLATWCVPCLTELADVQALQRKHGDKDFTVVAVGMDLEGALVLEPFAQQYQLPFPLLVADDTLRAGRGPFGRISALPTTFLLNREGRVVLAYEGPVAPGTLDGLIARTKRE